MAARGPRLPKNLAPEMAERFAKERKALETKQAKEREALTHEQRLEALRPKLAAERERLTRRLREVDGVLGQREETA